jgi:heme exporter protein CcmD
MAHLPFIVAAYAVTLGGLGLLLGASWLRMRAAEAKVEGLATARDGARS